MKAVRIACYVLILLSVGAVQYQPHRRKVFQPASGGGGGGGSMAIVATQTGVGNGSAVKTTTGATNTTGSTLAIAMVSGTRFHASRYVTNDNTGQTFTLVTNVNNGNQPVAIYMLASPTTGSGSTVSVTAPGDNLVGQQALISVIWVSGGSSRDGGNTNICVSCSVSGVHSGAITPSVATGIAVAVVACATTGTWSVDSSYTILHQASSQNSGTTYGAAYKVNPAASSQDPIWTKTSTAGNSEAAHAAFMP